MGRLAGAVRNYFEAIGGDVFVAKRRLALLKHSLDIKGRKVLKTLPKPVTTALTNHEGDGENVSASEEELNDEHVEAMSASKDNYGKKVRLVVEREILL